MNHEIVSESNVQSKISTLGNERIQLFYNLLEFWSQRQLVEKIIDGTRGIGIKTFAMVGKREGVSRSNHGDDPIGSTKPGKGGHHVWKGRIR